MRRRLLVAQTWLRCRNKHAFRGATPGERYPLAQCGTRSNTLCIGESQLQTQSLGQAGWN